MDFFLLVYKTVDEDFEILYLGGSQVGSRGVVQTGRWVPWELWSSPSKKLNYRNNFFPFFLSNFKWVNFRPIRSFPFIIFGQIVLQMACSKLWELQMELLEIINLYLVPQSPCQKMKWVKEHISFLTVTFLYSLCGVLPFL